MGRRARGWRADLVDRAVGDGLLPRAKRRGQRRGDLFSGLAGALGQDVVLSVAQKGDLAGWIWMSADSDSTGASEKMGWGPRRSCAPHRSSNICSGAYRRMDQKNSYAPRWIENIMATNSLQSFAVVGECCGLRNRPQSAPTRSAMASAQEPAGFRTAKVPPIHAIVRQRALICPSARMPLAPYASRQAGSRGFGA
jgi:hypothetical protein